MDRELTSFDYRRVIDTIRRANAIAANNDLDDLLDQMLDLFVEVASAEAGTLYLYDPDTDELIFKVVKGDPHSQGMVGSRFPSSRGIAGAALHGREPIFIPDVAADGRWDRQIGELSTLQLTTMYCLPLLLRAAPIGVLQVFNLPSTAVDEEEELALLQDLGERMASEIQKARLLAEANLRQRRLNALVDIISRLTTTLERRELLTRIMNHARDLLEVEATSVWELDDQADPPVLRLHVATGERGEHLTQVTVPIGQGIIGQVVATGERMLVEDVSKERRHYKQVDEQSGFVSRSILCVPLRAPSIQLGQERGELQASIIGGAQALNKRNGGVFTQDDIDLFETLASQAATVLKVARLNEDTYKLFKGVIKVVAGAVDAKDPYTQGHSQRVSEFAVAIAEELGLSRERIVHVEIGGILHDVGKIGVPDAILKKDGRLSEQEFAEIKKHPSKGYEIMSQEELRWLLREELPALLQHHEREDGRGYPQHLVGEQISEIGKIVHVADVFDALTSDRPYHQGRSADLAFSILLEGIGPEFDHECVHALLRAREKGKVLTQRERDESSVVSKQSSAVDDADD
ncbi:MAG TPA: HD domain-containing phosphohydrolase [Roseiflexaceae bacterium]|nr:HD domain-containing phosphohydrolase [Roseiflexaceae bacterium]